MSNAVTSVLVPLSEVPHLESTTSATLWGEVSCALGSTFNWAGHDILCDEEVPAWGVLRVEDLDFVANPVWGHTFRNSPCYVAGQ